jgi:hypothetical protein
MEQIYVILFQLQTILAPAVLVVMEALVLMHIMGITVLVRMDTLVDNVKQVSY